MLYLFAIATYLHSEFFNISSFQKSCVSSTYNDKVLFLTAIHLFHINISNVSFAKMLLLFRSTLWTASCQKLILVMLNGMAFDILVKYFYINSLLFTKSIRSQEVINWCEIFFRHSKWKNWLLSIAFIAPYRQD